MEWPSDCHFSPLDETLYGLLSPQPEPLHPEWNSEENKLFENALAEFDPSSPDFFESIASKVPWRSVEEIKLHYQALIQDLEMIESGNFPIPEYPVEAEAEEEEEKPDDHEMTEAVKRDGEAVHESRTKTGQPRRRGVPWTEEEHQLFLMGLNKYGKGDWRSISRYYVITKTPTQVASHAQKYFRRQMSSTPVDRRRPSIHDIHTVSPAAGTFPGSSSLGHYPHPHHMYQQPQPVPNFSTCALMPNLHGGASGFGGGGMAADQGSGFLPPPPPPPNTGVVNHDVMFNPIVATAPLPPRHPMPPPPPPSFYVPPFGNQNWGSGV